MSTHPDVDDPDDADAQMPDRYKPDPTVTAAVSRARMGTLTLGVPGCPFPARETAAVTVGSGL